MEVLRTPFFILAMLVAVRATHSRIENGNLAFKISGRNLEKGVIGKSDPFALVFLSNDGGKTKQKIGETEVVKNDLSPDWATKFEVHFDRQKAQFLYFKIKDADKITRDDNIGAVWMNVADYVDKGEFDTPKLSQKGHLEVKRADGVTVIPGHLQLPTDVPGKLFFTVKAMNLPSNEGKLLPFKGDPYITVSYSNNPDATIHQIERTSAIQNDNNPEFKEVLQFEWNKNLDQRLRFRVYENDKYGKDDFIEEAWLTVGDYVAKGQHYTLLLPKGGTLTIEKAFK